MNRQRFIYPKRPSSFVHDLSEDSQYVSLILNPYIDLREPLTIYKTHNIPKPEKSITYNHEVPSNQILDNNHHDERPTQLTNHPIDSLSIERLQEPLAMDISKSIVNESILDKSRSRYVSTRNYSPTRMTAQEIRKLTLKDINLSISMKTGKKGKYTKKNKEEGVKEMCDLIGVDYKSPQMKEIIDDIPEEEGEEINQQPINEKAYDEKPIDQTPSTGGNFEGSTQISNYKEMMNTMNLNDNTVPLIEEAPQTPIISAMTRQRPLDWSSTGYTPSQSIPRTLQKEFKATIRERPIWSPTGYTPATNIRKPSTPEESMASYHTLYQTPNDNVETKRGNKKAFQLSGFTPTFSDSIQYSIPFHSDMSPIENTSQDINELIRKTDEFTKSPSFFI